MRDVKKCFKPYSVFGYDKEEQWLREMHQKGWKLRKGGTLLYTFDRCENEDAVYKLDFQEGNFDKNSYLQMFADYGWEYVREYNHFYYFRKPVNSNGEMNPTEFEIFSDDASKLDMMKRVLRNRVAPLSFVFLCAVIPNVVRSIDGEESHFMLIFWLVMLVIYLFAFLECFLGYRRNKKKIQKDA